MIRPMLFKLYIKPPRIWLFFIIYLVGRYVVLIRARWCFEIHGMQEPYMVGDSARERGRKRKRNYSTRIISACFSGLASLAPTSKPFIFFLPLGQSQTNNQQSTQAFSVITVLKPPKTLQLCRVASTSFFFFVFVAFPFHDFAHLSVHVIRFLYYTHKIIL